jgi:hypothetical protein
MRDALELTEGNLTSLICTRDQLGLTVDNTVLSRGMAIWRQVVRGALGHRVNANDCPRCGATLNTSFPRAEAA